MRKAIAVMAVTALVAMSGQLLAHEGHEHKIMGKVVTIDETHIEDKH